MWYNGNKLEKGGESNETDEKGGRDDEREISGD